MKDEGSASPAGPKPLRFLLFVLLLLACIAAAGGYAWWVQQGRSDRAVSSGRREVPLDSLPGAPYLLMRISGTGPSQGRLALEKPGAPDGERRVAARSCDRVHAAAGRIVCLEARRRAVTTYHAHLLDAGLKPIASFDLAGAPSRARMSADGTLAATTVFVSGHAYGAPGFSTRTSIIDVRDGKMLIPDLESLVVEKDGQPFKSVDFNFWGVSFTPDAKGFYATMQTAGRPWLVHGDIAERRMTVVAPDVECPSLSPDGARVAFKRRVSSPAQQGGVLWRLVVRDLATGREATLDRETRNVDDQVEWLDDHQIAYALPDDKAPAVTNVWALAVDNGSSPRLILPMADSPAMVRR